MAFLIHSDDDGQVRPWEYVPCDDITISVGMALVLSSGHLVKATGTTKPTYISMTDKVVTTDGDLVPVVRVDSGIIFETTNTAAMSGVGIGAKVTLHTDALQVTATTSSGVAEVVAKDAAADSAAGGMVRVRF